MPYVASGKRDWKGGSLPSSMVKTDLKNWFNRSALSESETTKISDRYIIGENYWTFTELWPVHTGCGFRCETSHPKRWGETRKCGEIEIRRKQSQRTPSKLDAKFLMGINFGRRQQIDWRKFCYPWFQYVFIYILWPDNIYSNKPKWYELVKYLLNTWAKDLFLFLFI